MILGTVFRAGFAVRRRGGAANCTVFQTARRKVLARLLRDKNRQQRKLRLSEPRGPQPSAAEARPWRSSAGCDPQNNPQKNMHLTKSMSPSEFPTLHRTTNCGRKSSSGVFLRTSARKKHSGTMNPGKNRYICNELKAPKAEIQQNITQVKKNQRSSAAGTRSDRGCWTLQTGADHRFAPARRNRGGRP